MGRSQAKGRPDLRQLTVPASTSSPKDDSTRAIPHELRFADKRTSLAISPHAWSRESRSAASTHYRTTDWLEAGSSTGRESRVTLPFRAPGGRESQTGELRSGERVFPVLVPRWAPDHHHLLPGGYWRLFDSLPGVTSAGGGSADAAEARQENRPTGSPPPHRFRPPDAAPPGSSLPRPPGFPIEAPPPRPSRGAEPRSSPAWP